MPSLIWTGKKLEEVDIFDVLPPDEGSINQIYGRIGSGKTFLATKRMLADLNAGQIVYANYKVQWDGYDERKKVLPLIWGILGLKKHFYRYPKENLHFLPIDEHFHDTFGRLTDCIVYLDEGHLAYDSYKMAKMQMSERANILHTRHFNRTVNVISQRPTAIHVTLRDNVNRFFKCEIVWNLIFKVFKITEYQDFTVYGTIDEEKPVSEEHYLGSKKVFNAYDTKYLRGTLPASQPNYGEIWQLTWKERWDNLFNRKKLSPGYPQKDLTEYYKNFKTENNEITENP